MDQINKQNSTKDKPQHEKQIHKQQSTALNKNRHTINIEPGQQQQKNEEHVPQQ